ncbi:hypothetical protein E3N88_15126 [Mikania micrantha]|uniref:Uncharacterized protein n=1 Tax=Mikania micrantha TaxID=192012 RepID=A0A5N6NXA2_9ASTR|nr:hypothetical protein E3N88_15126 [Mikania micrantha]
MNSGCSKSPDPSKSEGSQTDTILLDLLKRGSTHLHYKKDYGSSFVFWSGSEGSENDSSSANQLNTIHDKIQSVFLKMKYDSNSYIGQYWAPVTINDRRLLSTAGQPFVINRLTKELVMYRLNSEKHEYDIDVNNPKIRHGEPNSAFLNRLSFMGHFYESESCFGVMLRVMLPICFLSDQSDCIGVIEINFQDGYFFKGHIVLDVEKALQNENHSCHLARHRVCLSRKVEAKEGCDDRSDKHCLILMASCYVENGIRLDLVSLMVALLLIPMWNDCAEIRVSDFSQSQL